jgi:kynurenine 3-monooxygenase
MPVPEKIVLIGAGLTGPLLATYLAKRGFNVEIFERRPDMRKTPINAGRSINLAVSLRGIHALKEVGLFNNIKNILIPMKGRIIHDLNGSTRFLPYGQDDKEVINSVSRSELNMRLINLAEKTDKVTIHFIQRCLGMDFKKKIISFINETSKEKIYLESDCVIGTDGSASVLRDSMGNIEGHTEEYFPLGHGYKELSIPADDNGNYKMEPHALHIWPRGNYMLIALPNQDCSFTCTLFFPMKGNVSFESLKTISHIASFFEEQFPDVIDLMPNVVHQYISYPTSTLGTVRSEPWNVDDLALIIGDAAHAIVPFFGQGMNAAFEDCTIFNAMMDDYSGEWKKMFSDFSEKRKQDTDAIADMAIENYIEMRDLVNDPDFLLAKEIERKLEEKFPEKFIPRYSMVSFHRIPYAEVYARGQKQTAIVNELMKNLNQVKDLDMERATELMADYEI